ncbi:MAG: NADH-ubiquinone oxidoreductase-F iron-sulfur binding region domain-containing protein [Spirochaetota bacterium]|nr:NADH-ubiquinone oxidoreductase-F iron-sulfur binding region domain-containing protein [Spirochaetota bacterium]
MKRRESTTYLTKYAQQVPSLGEYVQQGGYQGLREALKLPPEEIRQIVIDSKLRGRGGAGFPTGKKWATLPPDAAERGTILVCNADEGEPGTFKDRYIMERMPYLMLEGLAIAAYAVRAKRIYVYIRGEYPEVAEQLMAAVQAADAQNYLGDTILGTDFSVSLEIRRGGGSYVVGDETALLSSLMGKRGYPWMKPPFPTEKGAWDLPTIVNNVETIACLPMILAGGADQFAAIGQASSPGPKLFSISGAVNNPGIYEFPMGVQVRDAIMAAGGVKGTLKAVQIGGTAGPVYTDAALNYRLDYDSMQKAGGSLGSGALVVMDSKTSMAGVLEIIMRFFAEESCGQCFPCRYGTRQLAYMAKKIAAGRGKSEYIPLMIETTGVMDAASFCPFGQSVSTPLRTLLEGFGDEIERFIREQEYVKEVV